MNKTTEPRKDRWPAFRQLAQRIRVPAGFVLAPLLFIVASPTRASLIAGAAISVLGLGLRAWASGYLRKNRELTTSGPYAHTRNPLYLGTLLLGAGVAIGSGRVWFIALFVALYLLIYVPVMSAEADTMRYLFPEEYETYSREVPLFIPRVTAYRPPAVGPGGVNSAGPSDARVRKFEGAQYIRHREYRAAIGWVVAYALLAAKMYLLGPR
ncbi:MAG TPA: isoprenylcysteine carboxylmethyltransferase family protein [Blastocatellia bacterium]|nr:isoprenylcysteine carboxylmethyltransferase family protein [Blastocatellia bacterium]